MSFTDVLIVGAGPTGLFLALTLRRYGISVRIIDKKQSASSASKALAIQARTLEILDDMDLFEKALDRGVKITGFDLHSGDSPLANLSLTQQESPYPFILSLPQPETEAIFTQALNRAGIEIERQVTLVALSYDDRGARATLKTIKGKEETVEVPWVIGCDGAHSSVRSHLNIPFEGIDLNQHFVLGDFKVQGLKLNQNRGVNFLTPGGSVGFIPLPETGHFRLIIQVKKDRFSEVPTCKQLEALLKRRLNLSIKLTQPCDIALFDNRQRQVSQWRKGPVFLAGDAAHIHSPTGGQGMNTGIQDAYNLGWKLGLVICGRARPALLDSYEIERKPVAHAVLKGTERASKLMGIHSPVATTVRNNLLGFVTGFNGLKDRIVEGIGETKIAYKTSPAVAEKAPTILESRLRIDRSQEVPSLKDRSRFNSAPKAGERAPDVNFYDAKGLVRLFELTKGPHFTLLLFDGEATTQTGYQTLLQCAQRAEGPLMGELKVYIVVPGHSVPAPLKNKANVLFDPGMVAHSRYGSLAESLYLIRPDGHIGYRSQPANADGLQAYLKRLFL